MPTEDVFTALEWVSTGNGLLSFSFSTASDLPGAVCYNSPAVDNREAMGSTSINVLFGCAGPDVEDSVFRVYNPASIPRGVDRPYIYVNMAMTLDGKVHLGRPGYLLSGSPADRRSMAELRAAADAVMIGAGTLRVDNPVLGVCFEDLREYRTALGMDVDPLPVVVTASGRIDENARVFRTGSGRAAVLTCSQADRSLLSVLEAEAEVLVVGDECVDLQEAVRVLGREFGVARLLVEGGPNLVANLLRERLVDEFFITLVPIVKGGKDTPTLVEGEGFGHRELPELELVSVLEAGGELFLRYRAKQ
ncbi:MAG: RibD family protein [Armatimonadota bacterium]